MRLGKKQELFSRCWAQLLIFALMEGYQVRHGEVQRSREQAQRNEAAGIGIANSLHVDKLAGDLNLFKNGKFLRKTEDHRPLGEFWEGLHPLCVWGGSWGSDGNHYAVTHGGRK